MEQNLNKLFSYETTIGDPVFVGSTRLIPFAQALRIRLPFINGGFVWNRPATVLVTRPDGEEQVLRVPDITRRVQLALLGGIVGLVLANMVSNRIRK
jgi:hypothetical protein